MEADRKGVCPGSFFCAASLSCTLAKERMCLNESMVSGENNQQVRNDMGVRKRNRTSQKKEHIRRKLSVHRTY